MAKPDPPRKIRCAIYTRKSSDEGLEQEFNSLDAQYEACSAYITSQRHEGWKPVHTRYDDGGISGGTLDRPGLQALLSDIDAGLIDMIVVYKIDRLTRSLSDFSKIIDRLDAAKASFVSVTQSFNTATSMGRLTLNMLLSFAQFEREVTAERIRDKIAASKAKGLWMGGTVPLGYDPHPDKTVRGLVINNIEAETVQELFCLYDQLGCLSKVEAKAHELSLHSKPRKGHSGKPMSRGAVHKLLTNPLYIGKITHKEKLYDGRHKPIIDLALWERVQAKLKAASAKRRGSSNAASDTAWLKGRLWDETGDQFTPSHTKKNERIMRYYISNRLFRGKDPSAWRLPAKPLEDMIVSIITDWLNKEDTLLTVCPSLSLQEIISKQSAMAELRQKVQQSDSAALSTIRTLLLRAQLGRGEITLEINHPELARLLDIPENSLADDTPSITAPFTFARRGIEGKLISGTTLPAPDQTLQNTLAKAHLWITAIKDGQSVTQIARAYKTSESYIRTRLPLATLSPKIQKAICEGTQPTDLTTLKLINMKIPFDWDAQEKRLGI